MVGGRQLNQQVTGAGKGQLGQVQVRQHRGVIDFGPGLGRNRQAFGLGSGGGPAQCGLPFLQEAVKAGALIIKMWGEHNTGRTVFHLAAQHRHGHGQVFGPIVDSGQQVTVQVNEGLLHDSVAFLSSLWSSPA